MLGTRKVCAPREPKWKWVKFAPTILLSCWLCTSLPCSSSSFFIIIAVCVLLINPVLPAFPAFLFGLAHSCRLLLLPSLSHSPLAKDDDAFFSCPCFNFNFCLVRFPLLVSWPFWWRRLGFSSSFSPAWCRHRSVPAFVSRSRTNFSFPPTPWGFFFSEVGIKDGIEILIGLGMKMRGQDALQ